MSDASVTRHVSKAASRFAAANQGNLAVIFAIALVPLISFIGAAIDYSRANRARSSMQSALDSTALMVSKDLSQGTITTSEVNTKAQAYFTALFTNTRPSRSRSARPIRPIAAQARPYRLTVLDRSQPTS